MRIVQLTPGAGDDFYCENCIRDQASLRQMRRLGTDILMVPLYLPPMHVDSGDQNEQSPIFFGGINVYLQQKLGIFRKTPRWVDRLFDAKPLLRWASHKVGMTDSHQLGQTTLSMLRGMHGKQVKEVERLVAFLVDQPQADAVLLSNALLSGLAGPLRDQLGCSVLCGLQDEEPFLDSLPEPYRRQCWALIAESCEKFVDGFLSSSSLYGQRMAQRLGLDPQRIRHVPDGVEVEAYEPAEELPDPPAIGFLSQMTYDKGLDLLVEAFGKLKSEPAFSDLELHVAGGMTQADEPYVQKVRARIRELGLDASVRFLDELDVPAKRQFLRNLRVLSVPVRSASASALYALEAWASAVPVVLPDAGVGRELIEQTGAGRLVARHDSEALAQELSGLLSDPDQARRLGQMGRSAVLDRYNAASHARRKIEAMQELLETR
jgi:glycosyltransferase involved in cell wall biosynthesis